MRTLSYVAFDNDFDTNERAWNPEIWAAETLAILEENMVVAQLVHTDFENEIASFGDTVNTRKPGSFTAKRKGTNDDVSVQAATAEKVPVVLNQHVHTSFLIRDGEESRSFKDLVSEYLKPAAKSLAEHIDRVLLGQVYQFLDNQVQIDPNDVATYDIKDCMLDCREKQNVKKVDLNGRNMILTTKSETEALKLDLFISAEKVGDEGTALREASLGKKLGYQTYMCQNACGLVSGTSTTVTTGNPGATDGATAAGATAITVITDASSVLKAGMYLTWDDCGGVYRIVSCSATALVLDRGVMSALPDDSLPTYYTEGVVDLTGDTAASSYPIGYAKEINIESAGVVPQVGQLVGFADSSNVVRTGEYSIMTVAAGCEVGDYYITLDRPLVAACEDLDKVHYGPAVQYNFAFDRAALALVCRPLALPRGGTGALAGVSSYNDLAMRVVITYNGTQQGHLVTLDLLCGVKVLDEDRGAVMIRA